MENNYQIPETPWTEPFSGPGIGLPYVETPRVSPRLQKTVAFMKSLQRTDGYWWFALEANESIGAEFIFLMHYLGEVDHEIQAGICRRILDVQRLDGTWSLYYDGPADLSTTVECYFALKLARFEENHPCLRLARKYILANGGIEKTRVFTKIHLAMFGIVPWSVAPAMPAEFILLPKWFPFTIYSFSSWARATIVPLLVFMSHKRIVQLSDPALIDELFVSRQPSVVGHQSKQILQTPNSELLTPNKGLISWESFFIYLDKVLKFYERIPFKPFRNHAIDKCSEWIWEHVMKTEDIYPALAYAALAFKAMGYANDSPEIKKPFSALKMFQQAYESLDVPALPDEIRDDGCTRPSELRDIEIDPRINSQSLVVSHQSSVKRDFPNSELLTPNCSIHQQCCISPVWDTPWMVTALLEAGVPANDPALMRAGRWLLRKQITNVRGDWALQNPDAKPGGWSFEFENDYFPDVDDTIQVLTVLSRLAIPWAEKSKSLQLGIDWLLSMQNDDGGWGAFDRNQTQTLVNRIPFSDHGACLDPSSPDITGRMIEFFSQQNFSISHPAMRRAIDYIWRTQEEFGGWHARWGINYIYGTWCVLTGLNACGLANNARAVRAVEWLASVQQPDGGFGESPESYESLTFIPAQESIPSQTGWALMGLVAGGLANSNVAAMAANWLLTHKNQDGAWEERNYTGTGFPNHFYIRYHGYRHYFPLLALARYFNATTKTNS